MRLICFTQDFTSGHLYVLCKAVMHGFRREQADAGMSMLFVIPRKEILAEAPGVLNAAEALRKVRTVLEGLELGL